MTEVIIYWSVAVIVVLITGISKSGFAGGAGAVAVPLLSLVMPPLQAIALMLPLLIIMDGFSVKLWWGQFNRKLLIALIPASIIGVVIGYATADQLSENWIRLILGVIAIAFVLMQLLPSGKSHNQQKPNVALGAIAGASAGFTSFLAHAGGPLLNMYLLKQKLQRSEFLATAVYFFAAINLFKLYPYIALEQFNKQVLWQGALLIPVALLGVALGKWLQSHLSQKTFLNIIYVLLFGLGCKLLYSALSELA